MEQIEHRQMSGAKDIDNRVVVHCPTWLRVVGGICSLGFAGLLSYDLAQGIGEDMVGLVLFICVDCL